MAGEIKQMDVQLQKYNEQLRTEFKDAHEKYRRQHIKLKVSYSPGETGPLRQTPFRPRSVNDTD